jgi:uridine kinase
MARGRRDVKDHSHMTLVKGAVEAILRMRRRVPARRGVLVALSGIDGSGKGYLAARITAALDAHGGRVAVLNVDGWLNLPHVRFDPVQPADHFYRHALRFDEMFDTLVLPLRDHRCIDLEMDFTEETATEYRRHRYELTEIDVILLEGIFLLKRELRDAYDCAFWIDCTWPTALERALARRQEGLSEDETVRAYREIYFPAQEIHLQRDDPRRAATAIIPNDPFLSAPRSSTSTSRAWGRPLPGAC